MILEDMTEEGTEPTRASSPLWSTLWHVLRIVVLGSIVGVLMFVGYLALAMIGV